MVVDLSAKMASTDTTTHPYWLLTVIYRDVSLHQSVNLTVCHQDAMSEVFFLIYLILSHYTHYYFFFLINFLPSANTYKVNAKIKILFNFSSLKFDSFAVCQVDGAPLNKSQLMINSYLGKKPCAELGHTEGMNTWSAEQIASGERADSFFFNFKIRKWIYLHSEWICRYACITALSNVNTLKKSYVKNIKTRQKWILID